MTPTKRKALRDAGYAIGDATDFLELTPVEAALVEARLALADALRTARTAAGLTQADLARLADSTQARVSKAERGDPSVSADLLLRALFATGATPASVFSPEVIGRASAAGSP